MFKDQATQKAYQERLSRYLTAMNGGTPDRIPIRFFYQEAAARYCGVSNQKVSCDYQAAFDVTRRTAQELGNDAVMLNAIWSNYGVAKAASWRYLAVPGVDTEVTNVNQFFEPDREEDQFLQAEEYEEFIEDPTAFIVNTWLPRATHRVKHQNQPVDFDHNIALMSGALAFGDYMNAFGGAADKLKYEAGIVSANSGMLKAPLDLMADKFRGYVNTCIDGQENPKQLAKACEALMPHVLANALANADPNKEVPITLWAHRGCVPFITPEMFDQIFWPTLKPILEELIRLGHQILFYGEGNWEAHYDRLLELPERGIIYHIDRGDPAYAAQKLKPKFAISGGLPYYTLARGSREEVKADLTKLLSQVKEGGGYILDATALMLSDIQPENLQTAVDFIMDKGVYSQSSPRLTRGTPTQAPVIPQGKRPPLICRSWEEEKTGYRNLSGDINLVKAQWEKADSALYKYLWTTVLW